MYAFLCICVRSGGLYLHVEHVPVPSCAAQSARVTNEFIQHVEYLAEGGSLCSLSLPAVKHQLVQHHRTVHGSRQTIALFNCFNHLKEGRRWRFVRFEQVRYEVRIFKC